MICSPCSGQLNSITVHQQGGVFFMGRKSKLSADKKLEAVMKYINNEGSYASIAYAYDVSKTTFRAWVKNYNAMGLEGISNKESNRHYTSDFKEKVVKEYLLGQCSYDDLSKKYKIPSKDTIISWVMKYNGHEQLKSSGTGGCTIMTRGRKTTFEERKEIVKYCIENGLDYTETSTRYKVSYQQVYLWVKKYNDNGIEGLQDRRGKRKLTKDLEGLSEIERLKAENELLQAENRKKQMEIDFLKKLEEIERRRS